MFKSISSRIQLPEWMGSPDLDSRWRRLTIFDLILDGKFYDHLRHNFYTEKVAGDRPVPIEDRRPSVQFRLPRYAARWAARKLFAGRHIPQVMSPDDRIKDALAQLLTQIRIWPTMFEAAYRGTVGSVAITLRAKDGKIGLNVWRAAVCSPRFDELGDLSSLMVHYIVPGLDLLQLGFRDLEPRAAYWFIRLYDEWREVTFAPIPEREWNPVSGDPSRLILSDVMPLIEHGLGFIPAIWIANLGGSPPDGACLWEDAIPNSIEIDYLLSQASRGTRYNCAPQLVTIGKILNASDFVDRTPSQHLAFDAATRQDDGTTIGGGDAKLLEMSGAGGEAALKLVEELKKMALEQIGLVQKDPSKLPGPLSGRAMEFLDEDSHDVAMQWRSTYGDGGALPLIKKIVKILNKSVDTDGLWLRWPRLYQPTPQDLVDMTNAMRGAATPQVVTTGESGGEGGGKTIERVEPLVDHELASAYLRSNMDLTVLGDEDSVQHAGMAARAPVEGRPEPDQGQDIGFGPHYRVFPRISVPM